MLLAVGLIFVLNWTANGRFNDPDTWWHLKIGEQIWETGALPTTDEFSYTTNNHDWLPHPWLADLTMYAAYRVAGLQGLFFWLILLGSCLVVVIYIHCAASSGNAKTALLGGLAAWFFATITLSIRPLMLGHLFLALELLLLHLGKTRDRRWLWGLPIVFALWVNCHGSFFLGTEVADRLRRDFAARVSLGTAGFEPLAGKPSPFAACGRGSLSRGSFHQPGRN